jgi:hypothetical protein
MYFLNDDELERLTRAKHAQKQSEVLDENGIYYIKRRDGSIITTWHHVNHPCTKRAVNDDMPNFSAVS